MTVLITLTTAGSDSGPFNLYSDVDGFLSAFETGVAKVDLLAGYSSSLVPDPTTIIRVMSSNPLCTNYIDLELYPVTTTTTTTLPLEFLLSYECDGETVIQIIADTITGGAPGYYPANSFFYDEASALANTSWSLLPSESYGYNLEEPNNTFWVAIIDSAGNVAVNSITTSCTTTTTSTTLAPLDFVLTSSCGGINATLNMTTYTGGSGSYQSGNNYFTSEAAALANTSWTGPSGSFAIGIGSTPGTYWMVIRDSLGTLKAKSIFVDCTA
jgi:hypothetical protein